MVRLLCILRDQVRRLRLVGQAVLESDRLLFAPCTDYASSRRVTISSNSSKWISGGSLEIHYVAFSLFALK